MVGLIALVISVSHFKTNSFFQIVTQNINVSVKCRNYWYVSVAFG